MSLSKIQSHSENFSARDWARGACLLGVALGLSACAGSLPEVDPGPVPDIAKSAPEVEHEIHDPWESLNRSTFWFNLQVDKYLLRPAALSYRFVLPSQVRASVGSLLNNVSSPVTFANDLLQGEVKQGGITLGRLVANSTIGVGGLFDVAAKAGFPGHESDFGQTMALWGAGEGPYLMLPLLGPSNVRDGIGRGVDVFLDPLTYVYVFHDIEYGGAAQRALNAIDFRASNFEQIDDLAANSVDYYAVVRSAYQQARQQRIYGNSPSAPAMDDAAFDNFE
jgi:phospholipid-binding lipoprotein MlaA